MRMRRSVSLAERRVTGIPVHMLTTSSMSSDVTTGISSPRSSCHSFSRVESFLASLASRSRSSAAYSYWRAEMASSFSLRTFSSIFETWLTENGAVVKLMRTREAASSMRSMALSGMKRSGMNRAARLEAEMRASSLMSSW